MPSVVPVPGCKVRSAGSPSPLVMPVRPVGQLHAEGDTGVVGRSGSPPGTW
jgi:hypothetical protein